LGRLVNATVIDYPADRIEIVVASDGSSDRTADIVRNFPDQRVRRLQCAERRGKSVVLNDVIPSLASDVVVLSDANTFMEPGAGRRLVRWLAEPRVGVAVGRRVLADAAIRNRNADGLYWRYETILKRCESRLGVLIGANGPSTPFGASGSFSFRTTRSSTISCCRCSSSFTPVLKACTTPTASPTRRRQPKSGQR
jgi:cellulose synthase/poly-beta-1,6-N-acetylglucosamine synthase-like glycosyltransferase